MRKVISLVLINILQGIRARTFWLAGLLCSFLLCVAFFLRVLAIGQKGVVLRSICLSSLEISALLLIVFGFTTSFFRERDARVKLIFLTYVTNFQYLLGKLLGVFCLIAMYLVLATFLSSGLLWFEKAWEWTFLAGGFSIFLKLCILSSFCLFYSCLFESPVFSALVTIFTYFSCELSFFALTEMSKVENQMIRLFYRGIYYLLPNVDKLDLKYQAIHGLDVSARYLGEATLYVMAYCAMIFCLSLWIFGRKEH